MLYIASVLRVYRVQRQLGFTDNMQLLVNGVELTISGLGLHPPDPPRTDDMEPDRLSPVAAFIFPSRGGDTWALFIKVSIDFILKVYDSGILI